MTLFPSHGDSREDRRAANVLALRLREVVQAALFAWCSSAAVRLDVRVSRRRGEDAASTYHCIILHRISGDRNAHASGDWLPWSWPLSVFTAEDQMLLHAGQVPACVLPCVLDWRARLRRSPLDPKVTV